jgi:hypothetical protein
MIICGRGFILRGLFMVEDGPEANIDPLLYSSAYLMVCVSDTDDTIAGQFITTLVSLPAQ